MTHTAGPETADDLLFPSPADLKAEEPLPPPAAAGVTRARDEVRAVLNGADDRLLVIAGPCSVHDTAAALEYAGMLAGLREQHAGDLLIVMRAYVDKPRTVTGWTGLLNDPAMDGGHDIPRGLRESRRLLAGLAALGVPAACEWVSPVAAPYLADMVTWSAIGARTTESQPHRQLASGLPMPAGWSELLEMVCPGDAPVVVGINARVADGRDPSWLWDVRFEQLAGRPVVATGERCRDLSVRFRYAGVDHQVVVDPRHALVVAGRQGTAEPTGEMTVDFIGNYTAFYDLAGRR